MAIFAKKFYLHEFLNEREEDQIQEKILPSHSLFLPFFFHGPSWIFPFLSSFRAKNI